MACNDINDDVNGYFRSTLSEFLSVYDCCDKDGRVRKCISFARAIPSLCSNDDNTDSIPNSGATSTMREHLRDFKDDYQACANVFVLMGDASRIPVLGYVMS